MAVPKTLWHYTDAGGFFGIVRTRQIWFHDHRFLNDRTERVYGESVLDGVLRELEGEHASDAELVAQFRKGLSMAQLPSRQFVASFSETAESISQWQRYGAGGEGYCIGFDLMWLEKAFEIGLGISSCTMIYAESDQRSVVRAAVRAEFDRYMEVVVSGRRPNSTDFSLAADEIEEARICLKNPHFADEREWRFVWTTEDAPLNGLEEFSVRYPYIKGHIAIPLKPLGRLPINEIVCGPALDPDIAVPTADLFMCCEGYDCSVRASALREIWRVR